MPGGLRTMRLNSLTSVMYSVLVRTRFSLVTFIVTVRAEKVTCYYRHFVFVRRLWCHFSRKISVYKVRA